MFWIVASLLCCAPQSSLFFVQISGQEVHLVRRGGQLNTVIHSHKLHVMKGNELSTYQHNWSLFKSCAFALDVKQRRISSLIVRSTVEGVDAPAVSTRPWRSKCHLLTLDFNGREISRVSVDVPWDRAAFLGTSDKGRAMLVLTMNNGQFHTTENGKWKVVTLAQMPKNFRSLVSSESSSNSLLIKLETNLEQKSRIMDQIPQNSSWIDIDFPRIPFPVPWIACRASEPELNAFAVNTDRMIVARWGSRQISRPFPEHLRLEYIRILSYPLVIGRVNRRRALTKGFENLEVAANDPFIDSNLYLWDLKSGKVQFVGEGMYFLAEVKHEAGSHGP